jgi:hypothetical protein
MSKDFKKSVDTGGTAKDLLTGGGRNSIAALAQRGLVDEQDHSPGVGCTFIKEAVPNYNHAEETENFISNQNNAHIVLGRDRPGHKLSGYGGLGNTQCASIDIVAGHLSHHAAEVDADGGKLLADPNFDVDAARIYVSQKANIDEYFGLSTVKDSINILAPYGWKPKPVLPSVGQSAVGVKADAVRIIGRQTIRLVTGKPSADELMQNLDEAKKNGEGLTFSDLASRLDPQVELSNGGKVLPGGIDLIARNEAEGLQPLARGKNLEDCLWDMYLRIEDLQSVIMNFVVAQIDFNTAVLSHRHTSPFFGAEVPPSHTLPTAEALKAMGDEYMHVLTACRTVRENCIKNKGDFLRPPVLPGVGEDKYILSLYNRTN